MEGAKGVLPLRLAQEPAEVGPSSPYHESPSGEGDPLRQCPHQLLHLLHHGLGVGAAWQLRHIQSSEARRYGDFGILLLDQRQEPAENREIQLCRPLWFILVGSCRRNLGQPGLLSLCLEADNTALKNSRGLHILLM